MGDTKERGFQRAPRKNIDMAEVERLYAEGLPLAQIAKRFNTTHTTIGDRLERRGIRIRGRKEALQILWRQGHPFPEAEPRLAGITPKTKLYLQGGIAALRNAGMSQQADEMERDIARANELAMKHGIVLQQGRSRPTAPNAEDRA